MSTDLNYHPAWPAGYDCIVLDEVDSTMAEAARRAPDLARPLWIMARHQTDARGRQGRKWHVPAGNLSATLIYRPLCTAQVAAQRSFMAANALFEALALYVPRDKLALKWPNDVLLDGGKVAGILLETSGRGPFVDWLAVGIGVNLAARPEGVTDAAFPPVSVSPYTPERVRPREFLGYLADAFATQEKKLEKFGFDRIRADWTGQAARLGEIITARTMKGDVTGTFDSVDADGNLVLITAKGPQAIPAADVYF